MATPSIKFLYGNDSSRLLTKDENNNYIVPLMPGTVYFASDGKIVWDYPNEIANMTDRILMGKPEIITKTIETIIDLNSDTWTDIVALDKEEFSNAFTPYAGCGTFALQVYVVGAYDVINAVTQSNTCYSGVVSWYWSGVSHPDAVSSDEILLHRSGMVMQDIHLYARIYKSASGSSILQLKSNTRVSIGSNNLTIKLRQLI